MPHQSAQLRGKRFDALTPATLMYLLYCIVLAAGLAGPSVGLTQADAARPEIGKALQDAQALLKAQKPRDALAKIKQADDVRNKTEYETYIVDRVRINAALAAGDAPLAARTFETIRDSKRMTSAERLIIQQALSGAYYNAKRYRDAAVWAERYFKDGGTDAQMRTLLAQSHYLAGEFAQAAKVVQSDIDADERAGRTPSEESLQLLANAQRKMDNGTGYTATLEKLVTYHPKKEYWTDVIRRIGSSPDFADRLSLDLYRLKFAVGTAATATDYMEAAQLALRDGFPAEANRIVEDGFAGGTLGRGEHAERHARLRDLASKSARDDRQILDKNIADAAGKNGEVMLNVGLAALGDGRFDEGIRLMEQGIAKGGLKQPDDARLHLGIAYLRAGRNGKAIETFKTVRGDDGAAALARLWIIHARHASR